MYAHVKTPGTQRRYNSNMDIAHLKAQLPAIVQKIPEISLVYLFGSQVERDTGPLSDVDLALLIDCEADELDRVAYGAHLFQKALPGERLDVISLRMAPVELEHAIIAKGLCLYERDVATRVEYEAGVMSRFGDYLPILRAQREDILKGGDDERRVQRYREALGRTERTVDEIKRSKGKATRRF